MREVASKTKTKIKTTGTAKRTAVVEIPAPDIRVLKVKVVGESSLICHRFSEKCKQEIEATQAKKAKQAKPKRDPKAEFNASLYPLPGKNKYGFPVSAFKKAMVRACTFVDGVAMSKARGAFFVMGDLVQIVGPAPIMRSDMVRIGRPPNKVAHISYRAEFKKWSCELMIRYNAYVISPEQIINMLSNAGFSVGVGDWRPEKDGSFGMFRVEARK